MSLLLVPFFLSEVFGLAIDAKLDLPDPASIIGPNGQLLSVDSSLSPKIVKAFFEINFIPSSKPEKDKPFIAITNSKRCPYPPDLCKYYFTPNKISTVQRVDDMIDHAKKDSDIPVIEGLAVPDEEKLLKELNSTIMGKVNKVVTLKKKASDDVPVYRGTVDVGQVLKRPQVSMHPDYRPYWPEIRKDCIQGPCNRRYSHPDPPPIYGQM